MKLQRREQRDRDMLILELLTGIFQAILCRRRFIIIVECDTTCSMPKETERRCNNNINGLIFTYKPNLVRKVEEEKKANIFVYFGCNLKTLVFRFKIGAGVELPSILYKSIIKCVI